MSAFQKQYYRINWKNYPSNTRLNDNNLNKMDKAIYDIDDEVVSISNNMQNFISNIEYDADTGLLTFTRFNGNPITVDTGMDKIAVNFDFDATSGKLIIILQDGTRKEVDLSAIITNNQFVDSSCLEAIINGSQISFDIKDGTITEAKFNQAYLSTLQEAIEESKSIREDCEDWYKDSRYCADWSQSYATGDAKKADGSDFRYEQEENCAKYFYNECSDYADDCEMYKDTCQTLYDAIQSGSVNAEFRLNGSTGNLEIQLNNIGTWTSLGRVLMVSKGNWDSTVQYQPMDLVVYNSVVWLCTSQCTGVTPTESSLAWEVFIKLAEVTVPALTNTEIDELL